MSLLQLALAVQVSISASHRCIVPASSDDNSPSEQHIVVSDPC